jgi:hypothetical protein
VINIGFDGLQILIDDVLLTTANLIAELCGYDTLDYHIPEDKILQNIISSTTYVINHGHQIILISMDGHSLIME